MDLSKVQNRWYLSENRKKSLYAVSERRKRVFIPKFRGSPFWTLKKPLYRTFCHKTMSENTPKTRFGKPRYFRSRNIFYLLWIVQKTQNKEVLPRNRVFIPKSGDYPFLAPKNPEQGGFTQKMSSKSIKKLTFGVSITT